MKDISLTTKVVCQSFTLSYVLYDHFNPSIFYSSTGTVFSDFLMLNNNILTGPCSPADSYKNIWVWTLVLSQLPQNHERFLPQTQ